MLACDVQDDIDRDSRLGPAGLNKATFWIAGLTIAVLVVGGAIAAAFG